MTGDMGKRIKKALSDKAKAKIDEYIADRVLVEGTQPHRKSDGAAA